MLSGKPSGTECSLKIETADGAINVQDFTGEEKPLLKLALHVAAIHFLQADSTSRHFRFLVAQCAVDRKVGAFENLDQAVRLFL